MEKWGDPGMLACGFLWGLLCDESPALRRIGAAARAPDLASKTRRTTTWSEHFKVIIYPVISVPGRVDSSTPPLYWHPSDGSRGKSSSAIRSIDQDKCFSHRGAGQDNRVVHLE
jgi:hypothetical protein